MPRWNRCGLPDGGTQTFRPMKLANGQTSLRMLYLETSGAHPVSPFAERPGLLDGSVAGR